MTSENTTTIKKICSAFLKADRDTQLRLEGVADGILYCRKKNKEKK